MRWPIATGSRMQSAAFQIHDELVRTSLYKFRFHTFDPPSSDGRSWLTWSIGIAKPTPTLPSTGLSIELLIPMTWPCELTSGPPEFPGLIAASVWIRLAPEAAAVWPIFDTIPSVNDPDSPNGEPMA